MDLSNILLLDPIIRQNQICKNIQDVLKKYMLTPFSVKPKVLEFCVSSKE